MCCYHTARRWLLGRWQDCWPRELVRSRMGHLIGRGGSCCRVGRFCESVSIGSQNPGGKGEIIMPRLELERVGVVLCARTAWCCRMLQGTA